MRTTKRFTPAVLERFARQSRGTGIFEHYHGWHQVTRGDPSSKGRSHILTFRGRPHDFLSDLERNIALFAWLTPFLIDLREQFPLSLEPSPHELTAYSLATRWRTYPGTLDVAKEFSIRHPTVSEGGAKAFWIMTTDLLLTLRDATGKLSLLAISCKPSLEDLSPRAKQLLALERAYWALRGVPWRLITNAQFSAEVASSFIMTWQWGLVCTPTLEHIALARQIAQKLTGMPRTTVFGCLADRLGSMPMAQDAFWKAVWTAQLPIMLPSGWRPSELLRLTDLPTFFSHNPIISGRNAWIA